MTVAYLCACSWFLTSVQGHTHLFCQSVESPVLPEGTLNASVQTGVVKVTGPNSRTGSFYVNDLICSTPHKHRSTSSISGPTGSAPGITL